MTRSSIRFLTILVGLAALLLIPQVAHAEANGSQAITITPATTQLSVDAGTTAQESFDVINTGVDGFNVSLSAEPFYVTGENYDPHFTQLPGTTEVSKWIQLSTDSVSVPIGKSVTIKYSITVPKSTAPGGYYAVIFAQTSPQNTTGGGVVPHNRVGNVLYITVNGDVQKSGAVTADAIPPFTFSSNIPLGVKVANTGGVHFTTTATMSITDVSGKEVFKANFDRIILPNTQRDISTSWKTPFPIGIYTVHRKAIAADKTITLPDETIFYISPWFLLCVVIFLGSVISLLVMRARQRKKEK